MLLRIAGVIAIIHIVAISCEQLEKQGNITVKYGNTTEIHFQLKDPSIKLLRTQLEALQAEQSRLFAELNAKFDKLTLESLRTNLYASNCAEATAQSRRSGVYQILVPKFGIHPFLVSCEEDTQGGGWTVVLRREDGSVKFYRYWNDYKQGFGNVNGEFFIGLDKLHALTAGQDQELLFELESAKGVTKFAKYDLFAIGGESDSYALQTLGEYSGDAGDSFSGHASYKFSARDRDNDNYAGNCAQEYRGGWWYTKCHASNPMGIYNESAYGKGVTWSAFTGQNESLKRVKMMIRRRR